MKAGDKIIFELHYTFSNNGHHPWYWIESFKYFYDNNPIKETYLKGDIFSVFRLVESIASSHGLGYREIDTFDGKNNFYNIHRKEFILVEKEGE